MKKLLTIVLAVAMVISTSGITIASIACTRNAQKRAAMCQLCQKSKSGRTTQKKSCCQQTAKFFAVKTNFSKPVQAGFSPLALVALLVVLGSTLITRERLAPLATFAFASPSAREKCVLISRFRI
jgi:hypothetical protein